MNISKEESQKLIKKYGEREWEKIKQLEFPKIRQHDITSQSCINEFKSLQSKDLSWKTNSKLISKFNHNSIIRANKVGYESPYAYWQALKEDYELFKRFLDNRYRLSDWFKEKLENWKWLENGEVPEFIYGIGLTTGRFAPKVSTFKPATMTKLIRTFAQDYTTIFDPFMGFAGRMIGALACGKNYVGQDLSNTVVEENYACYKFLKENFNIPQASLTQADSFQSDGYCECLITCPPYSDKNGNQKEEWLDGDKKISCSKTCDEIITYCLDNIKSKKYIFVVDSSIEEYRDYIVGTLENINYINARNGSLTKSSRNHEAIVVIA